MPPGCSSALNCCAHLSDIHELYVQPKCGSPGTAFLKGGLQRHLSRATAAHQRHPAQFFFSSGDAAAAPGAPGAAPGAPGAAPGAAPKGDAKGAKPPTGDVDKSSGNKLTFIAPNGKQAPVSGDSLNQCIEDCKAAPELKDGQGGLQGIMGAATGGQMQSVNMCINFCNREFEMFCFPGDSTVIVRNIGRVAMSKLQVGDEVMALASRPDGGWDLRYDPVIAFIHREPEAEGDVLQIYHELGKVQLTAAHLLFAQSSRSEGPPSAVMAREVRIGNYLLSPWIDGSLALSEVLSIEVVRKRGLFAPLVEGGTLLVDATAASCYALPRNIAESPGFQWLSEMVNRRNVHATAHALFLPLRILHRSVVHARQLQKECKNADDCALSSNNATEGYMHPYAWMLYVFGANLMVR